MQPKLLNASKPESIKQAAALLKSGQLIAFPTDTVYGIGADAYNSSALKRLYEAKHRPNDKGIPILLAGPADIHRVISQFPAIAREYMNNYWPGPLTIILPKHPALPDNISSNDTVAVRASGGAVAASSANQSGDPPAHTAEEAQIALGDSVAAILDGGRVDYGIASTIIDCTTSPPTILRPGPISAKDLDLLEIYRS